MCPEPMEDEEYRDVGTSGETQVEEDKVGQRRNEIIRVNGIIWLIFAVIEVFIGLRVILKLIAANPDNAFANFIYSVSHVFLSPFFGLVGEPTSGGSVFEITSVIAMIVYLLIAWGITRLVYLLMMPTGVRHVRTVHRH
ncbi:MAG: YggT family protein [Thermoleophilia bacterium]|nr:YggT family protein [Actinomycetota bacterium]MCL6093095.1 YggT family protein [Actinomycetota bacterium]MDA8167425.1 YggT family protein [Actinomycetota bacterium]